jgi:hypothetical protein
MAKTQILQPPNGFVNLVSWLKLPVGMPVQQSAWLVSVSKAQHKIGIIGKDLLIHGGLTSGMLSAAAMVCV